MEKRTTDSSQAAEIPSAPDGVLKRKGKTYMIQTYAAKEAHMCTRQLIELLDDGWFDHFEEFVDGPVGRRQHRFVCLAELEAIPTLIAGMLQVEQGGSIYDKLYAAGVLRISEDDHRAATGSDTMWTLLGADSHFKIGERTIPRMVAYEQVKPARLVVRLGSGVKVADLYSGNAIRDRHVTSPKAQQKRPAQRGAETNDSSTKTDRDRKKRNKRESTADPFCYLDNDTALVMGQPPMYVMNAASNPYAILRRCETRSKTQPPSDFLRSPFHVEGVDFNRNTWDRFTRAMSERLRMSWFIPFLYHFPPPKGVTVVHRDAGYTREASQTFLIVDAAIAGFKEESSRAALERAASVTHPSTVGIDQQNVTTAVTRRYGSNASIMAFMYNWCFCGGKLVTVHGPVR